MAADLPRFFGGDAAVARSYDLPIPESKPGFGRLLFDSEGYLWVSEYAHYSLDPVRWSIFDLSGAYLGDVAVPERFQLFQILEDRLVGRHYDQLDRESVWMLGLRRGS